jgi:hypothetical protein
VSFLACNICFGFQDGPEQSRYNTSESSGSSSPVGNREPPPLTNGNSTFEEDRKEEEEEDKATPGEGEEKNRMRIWRKHLLVKESGETTGERRRKEEAEQEVNNNNQGSGERKGRACKGQRYKEFINTLQATLPRKKSKLVHTFFYQQIIC